MAALHCSQLSISDISVIPPVLPYVFFRHLIRVTRKTKVYCRKCIFSNCVFQNRIGKGVNWAQTHFHEFVLIFTVGWKQKSEVLGELDGPRSNGLLAVRCRPGVHRQLLQAVRKHTLTL